MPRTARAVVPGFPHHIIQRGHNKQDVFAEPGDFQYYLATLAAFKEIYGVKVYAFCLMTNHVHLILQPGDDPAGLGQLMKRLAGRQTRLFNRQEGRSGTLWEGRYKSSPVETDAYLLACCRYVELNPVRAGMVADPAKYRWSSHAQRIGESTDYPWLDSHPGFDALGSTEVRRRARYRDFVASSVPPGEWDLIRDAVQRGQLTGRERFVDQVARLVGRRIEHRRPGRPGRSSEK
jgi:putative transposase